MGDVQTERCGVRGTQNCYSGVENANARVIGGAGRYIPGAPPPSVSLYSEAGNQPDAPPLARETAYGQRAPSALPIGHSRPRDFYRQPCPKRFASRRTGLSSAAGRGVRPGVGGRADDPAKFSCWEPDWMDGRWMR